MGTGFPSPADDDIEKKLDLNELLIKQPAATFFLKAQGNAFESFSICDHDILIVDRSISPNNLSIVVFIDNGEMNIGKFHQINNKICDIWGVITAVVHRMH